MLEKELNSKIVKDLFAQRAKLRLSWLKNKTGNKIKVDVIFWLPAHRIVFGNINFKQGKLDICNKPFIATISLDLDDNPYFLELYVDGKYRLAVDNPDFLDVEEFILKALEITKEKFLEEEATMPRVTLMSPSEFSERLKAKYVIEEEEEA